MHSISFMSVGSEVVSSSISDIDNLQGFFILFIFVHTHYFLLFTFVLLSFFCLPKMETIDFKLSLLIQAFKAINFLPRIALALIHRLIHYFKIFCQVETFLASMVISSLTHRLFRLLLLNFSVSGTFPVILLFLVFNLILLWSETMFGKISFF